VTCITLWYTVDVAQLIARVPDKLLAEIDGLVAAGKFASRSDVVREAIVRLVDRARRDEIGRRIAEAYERMPLTEEEFDWSDVDSLRLDGKDKKKRRGRPRPR
jgi:Arc/MetJ-type ribon-helix-helix transcriptional regulator